MNNSIKKKFLKAGVNIKAMTALLAISLLLSTVSGLVGAYDENKQTITENLSFSEPTIAPNMDDSSFVDVKVDGAPSTVHTPRAPLLPRRNVVIELPFGATNIDADFTIDSSMETMNLGKDAIVFPAPIPVPLSPQTENYPIISLLAKVISKIRSPSSTKSTVVAEQSIMDDAIYSSDAYYPDETFEYDVSVGRNEAGEMATFVVARINPIKYSPGKETLKFFTQGTLTVSYDDAQSQSRSASNGDRDSYDLLILSANAYADILQKLVTHKEDMGLSTKLVTLQEVYDEDYFDIPEWTHDDQETLKYFIYKAWEEWDVKYVLAVGGFRTFLGFDVPDVQFPIRYSHLDDGSEPGYACDQYYSCFLNDSYAFDDWDTNDNGIFGENYDTYDPHPDIFFGRLACRNKREVKIMVNKIITYETETYGKRWFDRMLTITGDGFGDLDNLAVLWDTDGLPDGEYTIYAQSELQSNALMKSSIDNVTVTLNHSAESIVAFHEWDHLLVEKLDEDQERLYPGKPVAHIVVPSPDNILGNTNVNYNPEEAYCSDITGWGHVRYWGGVMYIKTKSYDPTPKDNISDFGSHTIITIWVNDSSGNTVFGPVTKPSTTYYEGEMECQKALDYMPDDFWKIKLWTSNGNWAGMWDVINTMSEGQGFVYFAGHGNPMSWGDHLPGIPGGRGNGMINGLKNFNLDIGWARYESEKGDPFLPMDRLSNRDKLPVLLVGGCHNSAIDASFLRLFADPHEVLFTVLHGLWVPECWAWWLERVSRGGAIATIGCSGLGYGYLGHSCLIGLGGWINPEFFRVYGEDGRDILGETFTQTITNYADNVGWGGLSDRKTFEEWLFLGDPSLKIGGYPSASGSLETSRDVSVEIGEIVVNGSVIKTTLTNTGDENLSDINWEIRVESDSPLGQYFGGTPFMLWLFKGRISEKTTSGACPELIIGEPVEIETAPVFGIGHLMVKVFVYLDENLATYRTEDGFVLVNRLILYHPDE